MANEPKLKSSRINFKIAPRLSSARINVSSIGTYLYAGTLTAGGGLVFYLKFDEGSGDTATDYTGNGNNGTLVASPTWISGAGNVAPVSFSNDYALSFNGSTQNVVIPTTSALDGFSAFTISIWIYPTSNSRKMFISKRVSGVAPYYLDITGSTGKVAFFSANGANYKYYTTPTSSVPLNQWSNIIATFNGSTDIKIYVGGVSQTLTLADSAGTDFTAIGSNAFDVTIGSYDKGTSTYFFQGYIDDVRLYSRVLTATEIASIAAGNSVEVPNYNSLN